MRCRSDTQTPMGIGSSSFVAADKDVMVRAKRTRPGQQANYPCRSPLPRRLSDKGANDPKDEHRAEPQPQQLTPRHRRKRRRRKCKHSGSGLTSRQRKVEESLAKVTEWLQISGDNIADLNRRMCYRCDISEGHVKFVNTPSTID